MMLLRNLRVAVERLPQWVKLAIVLALVVFIALLDYLTGEEISFSVFYVLPVGVAAWWSSRRVAYLVAILAALGWYEASEWAAQSYSRDWIRYWNGLSPFLLLVMILHLVHQLRTRLEAERWRANRDPLTGLLNMHAFHLQAETELARARRTQRHLPVVFLDLDNFKAVNDSLGHAVGNQILQTVAETMRRVLRQSDLLARAGGDEFAILLTDATADGAVAAVAVLQRELLQAMAQMGSPVTFSIGLAIFTTPPANLRALLQAADQLMYEVKRGGKNAIRTALVPGE